MFVYTNANPNKYVKAKDNVIQALSNATGIPWIDIYNDLCVIGKRLKRMNSEIKVYERWLREFGFTKHKAYKGKYGVSRVSLEQFCKDKPDKTYIVRIRGRLTCVKNGNILDTYDCSKNIVGTYWNLELKKKGSC